MQNCRIFAGDILSPGWLGGKKSLILPWLVWLTRLSTSLWTKGLPVQFPVRVQETADQCFSCISTSLSLSFSLPSPLSKKYIFKSSIFKLEKNRDNISDNQIPHPLLKLPVGLVILQETLHEQLYSKKSYLVSSNLGSRVASPLGFVLPTHWPYFLNSKLGTIVHLAAGQNMWTAVLTTAEWKFKAHSRQQPSEAAPITPTLTLFLPYLTSTSGLLCRSTTWEEKFSRHRAACSVARTALR